MFSPVILIMKVCRRQSLSLNTTFALLSDKPAALVSNTFSLSQKNIILLRCKLAKSLATL